TVLWSGNGWFVTSAGALPDSHVAVVARTFIGVTEVAEQDFPSAGRGFGVAAHHLQAGGCVLLELVLRLGGCLGDIVDLLPIAGGDDLAGWSDIHGVDVLQAPDDPDDLRVAQVQLLTDGGRVDGFIRLADGGDDGTDVFRLQLADAGLEAAETQIGRVVEEQRLGGLAISPGATDLLVVAVQRVADAV